MRNTVKLTKSLFCMMLVLIFCGFSVHANEMAESESWEKWGVKSISMGSPPIYSFKAKSDVWVRNNERPMWVDVYLHDMKYQGPSYNQTRIRVVASAKHKISGKIEHQESNEIFGKIKEFQTRLKFPAIRSGDYEIDIKMISIEYLDDGYPVWSFIIKGADSRQGTSFISGQAAYEANLIHIAASEVQKNKKPGQYVFGRKKDYTGYNEVPIILGSESYTVRLTGSILMIPKLIDRVRYVYPHLLGDTHEGTASRCEHNVYAVVEYKHQNAEVYTPYEAWQELDSPLVALSANFFDVRKQEAHTNWKMNRCSSPMGMYYDNVTKGPTQGTHNSPNKYLAGLPYFINPNNNKSIKLDTMLWLDDVYSHRMLIHADSLEAKNVEQQMKELDRDGFKYIAVSGVGINDRMDDASITPTYAERGLGRVAMSFDEGENLIYIYQGGEVNDGLDRRELYGLFKALHVDNAIEFSGGPYAAIAIKNDSFTVYGGIRAVSSCPNYRVWCSEPTNEKGQPGATPAWLGISNR
ncbi:phosphodiester glycosidase family protein [Providencia rettgeri]|uniref:LprO protein n=1 Tax=Providencia rettgeri TaxID=587 RepID=A0AAD2VPN5_PRORE|nr:LprO protein [Providencia rettgeri]